MTAVSVLKMASREAMFLELLRKVPSFGDEDTRRRNHDERL